MGSIVTSVDNSIHEVIDGQQRLTTLIILAKVICECYGESLVQENEAEQRDVTILVLNNAIKRGKNPRATMRPQDFSAFENAIISGTKEDFYRIKEERVKTKELKNENNIKLKYEHAVRIILVELERLIEQNKKATFLQDFINYIFNDVYVVLITATSRDTAIELFNIINNRGLNLEAADIVKAAILDTIKNDDHLSEKINMDWDRLKSKCDGLQIKMTDLLVSYQHYFYSANPGISLTRSVTKDILPFFNGGALLMNDIVSFADGLPDCYKSNDLYMMSLNYLPWKAYWPCILATAKKTYFVSYNELSKLLCSYYYINWILGGTGNTIKNSHLI